MGRVRVISDPPSALVARPPAAVAHYTENPVELSLGNTVRLLEDGRAAFPAFLAAIAEARERISMEMYIFADDGIGRRFAAALKDAARRGVTVRLLYDAVGCRSTSASFFSDLRAAGVRTIAYHRARGWRPRFWALFRRNHRKTLVVDGQRAFTGGINIGDEWQPAEEGGGNWKDAVVELTGPAVRRIEAAFLQTWNRRERRAFRLAPEALVRPAPTGATALTVIANTELRDRFAIRRAALHAIRHSKSRVYLANPYFVPDIGILRALHAACARGVDVRVVFPARSDSRVLDHAVRANFPYLLKSGVRIFQHPRMVHSKVLLVDDHFVSIGSYNMDHRSLAYNLEMVVNTLDADHAGEVRAMMERDMGESFEVTAEHFARRSIWLRILERLAWAFRKWL